MPASLLFIAIAIAYFHPLLTGGVIFSERDLSAFFIPPRYLWVELARGWQFPLWNPCNYSGIPLLAALQPAVLYPPHVFYLFLPFPLVWNWIIILHFPFAATSVYALLRRLKASREASFLGGITFMLSGYLISVHNLLSHLLAVPWFPLVLLFFLKFVEARRVRHIILSSVFLVMELLAGAPEIVIMNVLVVAAMIPFADSFVEGAVAPRRAGCKGLLYIVLFFCLISAVQLLPFYELKAQSIRKAGLSYREASVWSLSWKDYLQLFIRDPFGNYTSDEKYWHNQSWLKTLYLGFMPFFLSAFYFLKKEKGRIFFAILIVLSLMCAMGGNTPVYEYLYRIPPFNSMRYPVKYLFIFFLAMSLTTALGFEALRGGLATKDRKVRGIVYGFFYTGFALALLWGYIAAFGSQVYEFFDRVGFKPDTYNDIAVNIHNIKRVLLFTFIFCVTLICSLRIRHKRAILLLIPVLVGTDLLFANYRFYQYSSWAAFMKRHPFVDAMEVGREEGRYIYSPKARSAFPLYPANRHSLGPAFAPLFGLYTMDGSEVFRIDHHERLIGLLEGLPALDDAKRLLRVLGVRYVITPYEIDDQDFRLRESMGVTEDKEAYLYEFIPFTGRFLLYGRARYVPEDRRVAKMLADSKTNLDGELLISSPGEGSADYGTVTGTATPLSLKANRLILATQTDRDGFLYASDTWYPGWRAYVDGKRTEIMRAQLAFRAIALPRGSHRVEFVYVPMSFYGGMGITIFGLALCGFLVVREKKREKALPPG